MRGKVDWLGLRSRFSCVRTRARYFADMKNQRRKGKDRRAVESCGKSLAEHYKELLRLREMVKEAEEKSPQRAN
jgi:hypothetical protein